MSTKVSRPRTPRHDTAVLPSLALNYQLSGIRRPLPPFKRFPPRVPSKRKSPVLVRAVRRAHHLGIQHGEPGSDYTALDGTRSGEVISLALLQASGIRRGGFVQTARSPTDS